MCKYIQEGGGDKCVQHYDSLCVFIHQCDFITPPTLKISVLSLACFFYLMLFHRMRRWIKIETTWVVSSIYWNMICRNLT